MSVNTANTLVALTNNVLIEPSNKFLAGFYQQLIDSVSSLSEIGNRLIRYAEAAIAFRSIEAVEGVAAILSNLPVREYQLAGQYYLARCAYRRGESPQEQLEQVYNESRLFKARALSSLAAIEARRGYLGAEAAYFYESIKAAHDIPAVIESLRAIAVVKAKEGSHTWAVKELESHLPLLRYASPYVYYAFLNSYAVELGEVGRLYEARNVSNLVLASPLASAYPEWRETADEIQLKAYRSPRSVVSFAQKTTATILQLPEREPTPKVARPWMQSAQVLNLLDWKRKMVKEPNGDNDINVDELSEKDLLLRAMQLFSNPKISEAKRRRMLEAIEKIVSEPED